VSAQVRVDKAGENRAACTNWTSSAGVAESLTVARAVGGVGGGGGRTRCHKCCVVWDRCPKKTVIP
jgi:hypothetical protein